MSSDENFTQSAKRKYDLPDLPKILGHFSFLLYM